MWKFLGKGTSFWCFIAFLLITIFAKNLEGSYKQHFYSFIPPHLLRASMVVFIMSVQSKILSLCCDYIIKVQFRLPKCFIPRAPNLLVHTYPKLKFYHFAYSQIMILPLSVPQSQEFYPNYISSYGCRFNVIPDDVISQKILQ